MVPETKVGCVRVCCGQRVQQGATTLRADARKEEQRSFAGWARHTRVHGVVKRVEKVWIRTKAGIQAIFEMLASGQLPCLGYTLWMLA